MKVGLGAFVAKETCQKGQKTVTELIMEELKVLVPLVTVPKSVNWLTTEKARFHSTLALFWVIGRLNPL